MKTKAAVVYEPGKRIEIEELDLDGPQDGEVLIRYLYAGLCHSDIHVAHGDLEAACRWCSATRAPGSSRRSGRA